MVTLFELPEVREVTVANAGVHRWCLVKAQSMQKAAQHAATQSCCTHRPGDNKGFVKMKKHQFHSMFLSDLTHLDMILIIIWYRPLNLSFCLHTGLWWENKSEIRVDGYDVLVIPHPPNASPHPMTVLQLP